MNLKVYLSTALLLFFMLPLTLMAQSEENLEQVNPTRYGVGFQGTFPANGLSGMMDFSDEITAQAIFGFFGTLKTFAGRGLYRFQKEEFWNMYGYGMLGAWNYSIGSQSETVLGLGFGAGFEYDWRSYRSDFPPIFWNIELGIGFVDFDEINYNFSTILFGAGLHYRF
ncbi:MAG: hypothetical protein JJU46_12510 [Balneolaceae bacterium]|nr:hypothetical protein [Balneolaceae bacterium]MCH8547608.1 porin family protein [Balneolaceae bacterium]